MEEQNTTTNENYEQIQRVFTIILVVFVIIGVLAAAIAGTLN